MLEKLRHILRRRHSTRRRDFISSLPDSRRKTVESEETRTDKLKVAVYSALVVSAVTFFFSSINHYRLDRLSFVNKQIEKLYGPLYVLTQADAAAWKTFTGFDYFKNRNPIFDEKKPPLAPEAVNEWRLWMTSVFQPFNVKIETVIVNNPHLMMGGTDGVPLVFQEFIVHADSYKAVMSTWKPTDRLDHAKDPENYVKPGKNVGVFNYPGDIVKCVEGSYRKLLERKESLENPFNPFTLLWSEPKADCVCRFGVGWKVPDKKKECEKDGQTYLESDRVKAWKEIDYPNFY